MSKKKYNKDTYHKRIDLYLRQNWLENKKSQLDELFRFCRSKKQKELMYSLLDRFRYLDDKAYNYLLNEVAEYIVKESGYKDESTQIVALTNDGRPDSAQMVLYSLQLHLYKKKWTAATLVNRFGESIKNFNIKNKSSILLFDEFIGSGKTLKYRIDYLRKAIVGDFELKCCFLVGMDEAIEEMTQLGVDIFCALKLQKGISEFFDGDSLDEARKDMMLLESKLADQINNKKLSDYSFGYGSAEALYSMEGCGGNTPNSVFPVFWWKKNKNGKDRNTLLTRCELGF